MYTYVYIYIYSESANQFGCMFIVLKVSCGTTTIISNHISTVYTGIHQGNEDQGRNDYFKFDSRKAFPWRQCVPNSSLSLSVPSSGLWIR